jgi:hypothetical protein
VNRIKRSAQHAYTPLLFFQLLVYQRLSTPNRNRLVPRAWIFKAT